MPKNSVFLPIATVLVIVVLTSVAIFSGRSNAPSVAADDRFPHHICSFNRYCAADVCTETAPSFVAYLYHEDGQPRLELTGMSPRVLLETDDEGMTFTSRGGEISGTLRIYNNRALDFTATSGGGEDLVEHFGSGRCDRLRGG